MAQYDRFPEAEQLMTGRDQFLLKSQDGFSLVMALWLMALLGIAGSMFAYQSIQQSRMTDAVIQRENAHSIARSGIELWMGQLRQDKIGGNSYDAFTENWGWGGNIMDGVSTGDTIYVPSGNNSYTDGDIGYFRIETIQDESGKHSVKNPLNSGSDTSLARQVLDGDTDPNGFPLRTLGKSEAENLLNPEDLPESDTKWISAGDLALFSGINKEYRNIGSIYREDGKINVNTAPFEALKGIKMRDFSDTDDDNCHYSCDYFLTPDLIITIMESRSGAGLSKPSDDADDTVAVKLHKQEKKSFINGGGSAFTSKTDVRDAIQDEAPGNIDDFQFDEFKKHIRLNSEGIFRVVVRGVSMDAENDPVNAVTLEAYVDRSQNPMRIISLREP